MNSRNLCSSKFKFICVGTVLYIMALQAFSKALKADFNYRVEKTWELNDLVDSHLTDFSVGKNNKIYLLKKTKQHVFVDILDENGSRLLKCSVPIKPWIKYLIRSNEKGDFVIFPAEKNNEKALVMSSGGEVLNEFEVIFGRELSVDVVSDVAFKNDVVSSAINGRKLFSLAAIRNGKMRLDFSKEQIFAKGKNTIDVRNGSGQFSLPSEIDGYSFDTVWKILNGGDLIARYTKVITTTDDGDTGNFYIDSRMVRFDKNAQIIGVLIKEPGYIDLDSGDAYCLVNKAGEKPKLVKWVFSK